MNLDLFLVHVSKRPLTTITPASSPKRGLWSRLAAWHLGGISTYVAYLGNTTSNHVKPAPAAMYVHIRLSSMRAAFWSRAKKPKQYVYISLRRTFPWITVATGSQRPITTDVRSLSCIYHVQPNIRLTVTVVLFELNCVKPSSYLSYLLLQCTFKYAFDKILLSRQIQ